jgi:hypothetical protein
MRRGARLGSQAPTQLIGSKMKSYSVIISYNVCGKRAGQANESVTLPTLRTSPISTYNGSTQSLSNYFK